VSTPSDHVVVVGAGASTLVATLIDAGYSRITAVDISQTALDRLATDLGPKAVMVRFQQADVCTLELSEPVDVWHDRATFHFLTEAVDQVAYAERAAATVRAGGHLVLATFAVGGPDQCSGLRTRQHSPESLAGVFRPAFEVVDAFVHHHETPSGADQPFQYAVLERTAGERTPPTGDSVEAQVTSSAAEHGTALRRPAG
jgi:threonine dehydrogenase-like Zn-dependent dehydrogenase